MRAGAYLRPADERGLMAVTYRRPESDPVATAALAGKQDAATAATDVELAAAIAAHAAGAATDAELASAISSVTASVAAEAASRTAVDTATASRIEVLEATLAAAYIVPPETPVPIIWDQDGNTDVDDFIALEGLLKLEEAGYCRLIAVTIDTKSANAPKAAGTLLHKYGRDSVPVGVLKSTAEAGVSPAAGKVSAELGWVAAMANGATSSVGVASTCPDSKTVMRTALAAEADGSVVLYSGGFLQNIADLLATPGDGISALTGSQLVAAKCSKLAICAGNYPSQTGFLTDYNMAGAPAAASYVFANSPVKISMAAAGLQGWDVVSGRKIKDKPVSDPLRIGLAADASYIDAGRFAWDSLGTLSAVVGPKALGMTEVQGTMVVNATTAVGTWTPGSAAGDKHYYATIPEPLSYYQQELNRLQTPETPFTALRRPPGTGDVLAKRLHYDASAITGKVDNDLLTLIPDQSGEQNDAVQTGASGLRPIYKTNIQNGLPVVRFSAAQWAVFYMNAIRSTQLYVFMVAIRRGAVAHQALIDLIWEPVRYDYVSQYSAAVGWEGATNATLGTYRNYQNLGSAPASTGSTVAHPGTGVAYQYTSVHDGTNHAARLNGAAGTPVASTGVFNIHKGFLGARQSGPALGQLANIDLCEVQVWGGKRMAASQITDIEAELKAKWGTP